MRCTQYDRFSQQQLGQLLLRKPIVLLLVLRISQKSAKNECKLRIVSNPVLLCYCPRCSGVKCSIVRLCESELWRKLAVNLKGRIRRWLLQYAIYTGRDEPCHAAIAAITSFVRTLKPFKLIPGITDGRYVTLVERLVCLLVFRFPLCSIKLYYYSFSIHSPLFTAGRATCHWVVHRQAVAVRCVWPATMQVDMAAVSPALWCITVSLPAFPVSIFRQYNVINFRVTCVYIKCQRCGR